MASLFIPSILRVLRYTGLTILGILLLMVVLPLLFPGVVTEKVKGWANKSIDAELDFSKARLSFFKHFPALTLTLHDFSLKGSRPFEKDTLLAARELSLGLDLTSILSKSLSIEKVYLTGGDIRVLVDEQGRANYNVYQAKEQKVKTESADSSMASFRIEAISLEQCDLTFDDRSMPMFVHARGFNYSGKGDMSQAVFELSSALHIDSLDLAYAGQPFIQSKKTDADLLTRINTRSLSLQFEKTALKFNDLPLQFQGSIDFLKQGNRMDLTLSARDAPLKSVLTAFPPELMPWAEKTDASGTFTMNAHMKGDQIPGQSMPSLFADLNIRNGSITHDKSPVPISNLFLDLKTEMSDMDQNKLMVAIDTLGLNMGQDYFRCSAKWKGLSEPDIKAMVNADLDLEKWQRALGFSSFEVKGRISLNGTVEGKYATGVVQSSSRSRFDTVITSIPSFNLRSSLRNGYFHMSTLPAPVNELGFELKAVCRDNQYRHIAIDIDTLNAKFLTNFIRGHLHVADLGRSPMDASIRSVVHLSDVQKIYPLKGIKVSGDLDIDVKAKGRYLPEKKTYPIATAHLRMDNGSVQTPYYPRPMEKIDIDATLENKTSDLRAFDVNLKPVYFIFEGKSFMLKADVKNLDDIKYDVASNGQIDLGKISRVFDLGDHDLQGIIKTDLIMKGSRRDAEAGRYSRLYNKGTLVVKDIELATNAFPKPLQVKEGAFHFDQDNMIFDNFIARYGSSDLTVHGKLDHLISYITREEYPLRGTFDLNSNRIVVDEFTALAGNGKNKTPQSNSSKQKGVVVLPADVDLNINASVKKTDYEGLMLNDLVGQLNLKDRTLKMQETHFGVVGTTVSMDGKYTGISPRKATFDYRIEAQDFDVKKAYKEIQLFRDLVPSASSAEGIISINYKLSGKLDVGMLPVYPSIKGAGVLSVKKVKMKGFKLMNAVSSSTGRDAIRDPDISKVDIQSRIENNIMTIERVKMKVAGFRPRFEGQVSLDGKLNLSGRLGLPPFGIFGIPFTVTGTQKNPKVQVRRSKNGDQLDESKEEEEKD
jgi:AsmA protein